jgi:general secretion pathway protein E
MENPFLEINAGNGHMTYPLEGQPVTIGRHASNALVISDGMASRSHCVIEQLPEGGFRIRDLNSSNGTKVNGQIVRNALLLPGDVINIGKTTIKLIIPGAKEQKQTNGDVDELTADDLVEADDGPREGDGGLAHVANDVDYEHALQALAESLPNHEFSEWDIALINGRGHMVHEAGRPSKVVGRREAVDLFRLLLLTCFRSRTTDIHLEPRQEFYQARLRIDGSMVDVARVPQQVGHRLATLVKVLSDIDIAQRNAIQEGHFSVKVPSARMQSSRRVDYRVSFAPSVFGQKLVVRVLDTANAPLRVNDLGLPKFMVEQIKEAIEGDSGMILVAGPTGSGKTTSLYALLRTIEVDRRNVVTIEDPVEIQLEGITQIPVNDEDGKSFSALLRSVLRQDPDVILVGEVRDAETARIAMQAAITGHLVFSTVHTKDTVGTIFRLLDLGVEPYLVGQGLHLVLAQRLVRQLCPFCKKPTKPTPEQIQQMGPAGENVQKIFAPSGCMKCLGTGYSGRRAFFEMMRNNDELRDVILKAPTMQEISTVLAKQKFLRLSHSGYQLVADGVVSFSEIDRAVGRL